MSDVVGLAFHEDRLECVVVRRRFRDTRVLHSFTLPVGEEVEAALRAKLRELGVRARRAHVAIPRRRAIAKAIELPAVAGADLRRMVGFELERHLPFPPSDAVFDFHVIAETPGQPVRVLLVAAERRVFERVVQLTREAGLVLRLVDVASHGIALLASPGAGAEAREVRVFVIVEADEAELAIVRAGRPLLSRAFPLPAEPKERGHALAEELRRSLGGLRLEEREGVADVTVLGGPLPPADWAELPLHVGAPLPAGLDGVPIDARFVPALAVALREPTKGALRTNLMPQELRPRPFPWPVAVTAALAAIALLLALAVPALTAIRDERRLLALNRAIEGVATDVRRAEELAAEVERARREVETLRSFEAQHVRALPFLRELTEMLPPDVWLTNLSVDRKGIELAGFANAASQLIPLLEASPGLERVEFTSPVTKGRDREQFRLKATWERPPGVTPEPAAEDATRPTGPTRPARPGRAPRTP